MVPSSVWDVGSAKNPFFFVQIIQLQNYVNHKYLREGDKNSKGKFISLIFSRKCADHFFDEQLGSFSEQTSAQWNKLTGYLNFCHLYSGPTTACLPAL